MNVTTPSKEEASSLNPVSLLRLYKRGFKTAFIGTKTLGNYKVDEIELIPEKKEFPWKKITFFINNQNHQPVSVRILDKKGDLIEIKFLSFNMQANLKDADFVFNKNKYPDAEIIDLR